MHRYLALAPNIATYGTYEYRSITEQEALTWIKHHHNQHKEHNHHFEVCFNNQIINNKIGELTGLYIPVGTAKNVLPALGIGDEAVVVDPGMGQQVFPGQRAAHQGPYKFGLLKCVKLD